MRNLAIIARDSTSAATLKSQVESEGFTAETFTRVMQARTAMLRRSYSLVLLDLDLPDADPFELCRVAHASFPVICLTDDPTDMQCLRAFAVGSDDCVRLPVTARELAARVRNLLRRVDAQRPHPLPASDEVEVFLSAMKVRTASGWSDLTRGETEILAILLRHAPAPVPVQRILELLPERALVKRGTVESRVKSLRRKIGVDRIVSRGSLGYQLGSALTFIDS